jgi:hypothetical protein
MTSTGSRPEGRNPRRGEGHERLGLRSPGNTARSERTFRRHESLEAARSFVGSFSEFLGNGRVTTRRVGASRDVAAIGRGNPLKAEAQGRFRHETRPGGQKRNKASGG